MMVPIKHYNDYSLTEEQIKRYQEMPMEKRLEWLYLGNILRKAFCEIMEREPFGADMSRTENSAESRG